VKVCSFFFQLVSAEDNERLFEEAKVTKLLEVMSSFQKGKILGTDAWTVEFFIDFFDIMGIDLLRVVEEVKMSSRVLPNFNSTFIVLIPKVDKPRSSDDPRPISMCNCVYKIIAKVLAIRLKKNCLKSFFLNNLGFWKGDRFMR
jgi:hypothetical protein